MHGNNGIKQKRQFIFGFVDVIEEVHACPVERLVAFIAGAIQLDEAAFQLVQPGRGLLALEGEAGEELAVLLLQPGTKGEAVGAAILESLTTT